MNIYDINGRLIKNLDQSLLPSSKGFVQWDGITNEGRLANVGIYVLYISGFHPEGNIIDQKLPFVVADFLD